MISPRGAASAFWFLILICSSFASSGQTPSVEGAVDSSRVDATYRAEVAECDFLRGVTKEVCLAEAAGKARMAAAERKVAQHPGAASRLAESLAAAESRYGISRAKCGDSSESEKPACLKAAESDRTAARATAQVLREMADEGSPPRRKPKRDVVRTREPPARAEKPGPPGRTRTSGP